MKKTLMFMLAIVSCISPIYAVDTKYKATQPSMNKTTFGIDEKLNTVIKDGTITTIDIVFTIPDTFNEKEIVLVPSLFKEIAKTDALMPGDGIVVNLKVVNNSKYEYNYKNQTFILATTDFTKENINKIKGTVSFNGQEIPYLYGVNRTNNTAITSLFDISKEKIEVTDNVLDLKLKEKGYTGINELNKYYLDFYNKKYNYQATKLEEFNDNLIATIFNGKYTNVKETNKEIAELGYNFWYNKLLSLTFENQVYDFKKSEESSIGTYMNNPLLGNSYFDKALGSIKSNTNNRLEKMKIHINGPYTNNAYQNYGFDAYMEFTLVKKEIEEPVIKDPIIDEPVI
ncbi:MAG: hypothetical protein RSB71_04215, partial [Bacilli bacterium]